MKELEESLKDTKSQEMIKMARDCYAPGVGPDRDSARDAAAVLAFSIALDAIDLSTSKIRNKVQMDVLHVVSHARSFGPRLRTHIWRVFNERTTLTTKQEKIFDRWVSDEGLSFDFYEHKSGDDASNMDGDCSTGSIHGYYEYDSSSGYDHHSD